MNGSLRVNADCDGIHFSKRNAMVAINNSESISLIFPKCFRNLVKSLILLVTF